MADKPSKNTKPKKKSTSAASPRRASSSSAPKPYKSNKPLFSAGTIITLVTFVLIVVVAIYIGKQKEAEAAIATPEGGETVFTEADGTPTSIKIEPAEGEAVQLDRNDQNVWELILPAKAGAEQSMAEAAATQVGAINIVTPEINGAAADFGLDTPAYVITIKFSNGQTHKLEIGDVAISNNGYYARLDKSKIMLVGLSGIDALKQLVDFPPYLNPPTPTALPATETPVPVVDTPTIVPPVGVTVTPTP